jgi:pyruvate,water dikinase
VDTDNLVVDKADGRVISRSTADKMISTGYAGIGTAEREVAPDRRREPVLDDQAAAVLTALGDQGRDPLRRPAGHRVGSGRR